MNIKKYPNPNPNGKALVDCFGCKERKEHHAKGYCFNCYRKFAWKKKLITCKNCGRKRFHKAFGLCGGCHTRLYHYDKTLAYNTKKYHNISLDELRKLTKSCVSCGFSKIVELHHLDGNKTNRDNKNLIGLCPNCHKMIHSYDYFDDIKKILKNKGYDTSNIKPSRGRT